MAVGEEVVQRARRWVSDHPASILSLAGLLLFGILRLNYEVFYSRLGVAPEEVGLSYASTVGQSALGLVLGILFATAIISMFLGASILNEYVARLLGHLARERLGSFARAVIVAVALIAAGGLLVGSISSENFYFMFASLFCLTVATTALMPDAFPRLFPGGRESASIHMFRVGKIVFLGGTGFGLLWALLLLPMEVAADAESVKAGESANAYTVPGLDVGVLSYKAVVSHVEIRFDPEVGVDPECLVYLGRADGVSVFFDVDPLGVVRVPTDDVVVRESAAATLSECEALRA